MLVEEVLVQQTPDLKVFWAENSFEFEGSISWHYEQPSSDVQSTAFENRADVLFFEDLLEFKQLEFLPSLSKIEDSSRVSFLELCLNRRMPLKCMYSRSSLLPEDLKFKFAGM